VYFVGCYGTCTKLLTSTGFVFCLFVWFIGVDNAMTITYFNLSGGGSNWWCAQFVVSWIIWTFPWTYISITDAFSNVVPSMLVSWFNSSHWHNKKLCISFKIEALLWLSASLQSYLVCWVSLSLRGSFALEPLLILCKWSSSGMCSNYRVISIWPSENYSCISGWTKGKTDIYLVRETALFLFEHFRLF